MYQSRDVLAHFEVVLVFFKATAQHATREKEDAIHCPCKVCNNNMMYLYKDREIIHEHLVRSDFVDNYFISNRHSETQPRAESIIDEREEENMNAISKKVIDVSELDELCKETRVTLCQLKMCLPPSFFDSMEHYMIHLADQIFVLGPSYMHYMYPYECHMVVMKGNVCNRAHPEGSMIEGYTIEEVIQCYTDYIKDGKPIRVPVP
jgi:hypothetical protein